MVDAKYQQLLEYIEVDRDNKFMSEQGQEFTPSEERNAESIANIDPDCDVSISGPRFQRDLEHTPRVQRLLRALGSASNVLFDIKRFPDA